MCNIRVIIIPSFPQIVLCALIAVSFAQDYEGDDGDDGKFLWQSVSLKIVLVKEVEGL